MTAVLGLYLKVFVLIGQLFRKVQALKPIALTQSEPPFQMVQLAVLLIFAYLGTRAAIEFHSEPSRTA